LTLLTSLVLGLSWIQDGLAQETLVVPVADDNELEIIQFPASGEFLLVWLAPEYGFGDAHHSMATRLSQQGIEVWQSDIAESLFLPHGVSSLKQLDGKYVADLISYAHRATGKKIAVAGDSYAAALALRGVYHWQNRGLPETYMIGTVLFTPYSYAYMPPLGLAPEYLPIVDSSNIPMMIYQATNSATSNHFDDLLTRLRQNNSPIYTRMVPDIMSLFYQGEADMTLKPGTDPIAISIRKILPLLAGHKVPGQVIPIKQIDRRKSGIDIALKTFEGEVKAAPIFLTDINGKAFIRENFAGQVTVINFWASWCPPCVEEIPSLNRLKEKMTGKPFELISINYAESEKTISAFLEAVKVDFPVLLDPDGDYARKWRVVSFPSTFVIDSHGEIRLGVNAAIEWDAPEQIERLESLMN